MQSILYLVALLLEKVTEFRSHGPTVSNSFLGFTEEVSAESVGKF
jgi:hypothetical protein